MNDQSFDTIRDYWSLKDDLEFPFDKNPKYIFPNQTETNAMKAKRWHELQSRLGDISFNDIEQCKKNVIMAIDKLLEIISANVSGYPLARDQGLIIENYVYGKLLGVLMGAVKSPLGYGYPNFYYERGGTFNADRIIILLQQYKKELQEFKYASYREFAEHYEKYKNEVLKMWEEENKKSRK
jgi:hypothetical protein